MCLCILPKSCSDVMYAPNLLRLYRKTYTIYSKAMKNSIQHTKASLQPRKMFFFVLTLLLLGTVSLTISQLNTRQSQRSLAAGGDCTVSAEKLQKKTQEEVLFEMINTYRVSQNRTALMWDPTLKKAAAWLTLDMLNANRLNHVDSLNRNPDVRLSDCGYTSPTFGENIANGETNPEYILNAWKNSQGHNEILLNSNYTHGAVAMEVDSTGQLAYWTLNVGNSSSSATITPGTTITNGPTIDPSITLQPSSTLAPTSDPNDSPTATLGPETPNMQIKVKIKMQGIGKDGNIYPRRLTRKVMAIIQGAGETPVANGTGFLTYDGENHFTGVINLGKMTQGVYFIKLMSEGTLLVMVQPEFQQLNIGQVNELPAVTLIPGDITSDNKLSIQDFNIALACFQDKKCPLPEVIDFNDDGLTDVTDYNVLLQSFAEFRGR